MVLSYVDHKTAGPRRIAARAIRIFCISYRADLDFAARLRHFARLPPFFLNVGFDYLCYRARS